MHDEAPENYDDTQEELGGGSSLFLFIKRAFWLGMILIAVALAYLGVHFVSAYRTIVVGENEQRDLSWRGLVIDWLKKDDGDNFINDPFTVPENDENQINLLVLGIRGENGEESAGNYLTDTMMIISADKTTGRTTITSLPRDLYIEIRGTLKDGDAMTVRGKINEIYERGLERGGQGLSFASQMISRLTGIYIDNAAVFDFAAFEQIVNVLGGIDITLASPFTEKTQWGYEFSLPAGENHLDGQQALYYVRSRFSSSDFDRARRQQQVILAIKDKAANLGFLASPSKITGLLDVLKGNIRTNIQLWEINDMLKLTQSFRNDNLKTNVISTDNLLYQTHTERGEYILLPKGDDFKIIREYFKNIFQ